MGSNTSNSKPVDIRGVQFVSLASGRVDPNFSNSLPTQLKAASRAGQPYRVVFNRVTCCGVMRNCESRTTGSSPISTNGARTTGPAIVIWYSKLVTKLASPPGNTICSMGIGTVQAPRSGLLGFLGIGEPSGFCRVIDPRLGR